MLPAPPARTVPGQDLVWLADWRLWASLQESRSPVVGSWSLDRGETQGPDVTSRDIHADAILHCKKGTTVGLPIPTHDTHDTSHPLYLVIVPCVSAPSS